ncbi:Hypothetical predicted protein [Paramuricea clavata]|uniref:Uncharacterized protein n=1 Tax=Paramuricea clavata TaxID=317549 RepID=A0A6S7FGA1_PARCT|nr:Hypothetical predicted protein [Paramuricea clavata]
MTRGNCATRFWSSQYMEFNTIIKSYKAYTTAFRSYGYSEMKEYDILGTDFVLDLCCICDSMKSVVDLMIAVQGLGCPCWKICILWPRVKAFLESLLEEVIIDPSESMPILKNHVDEIMKGSFKGQKLVQGWKLSPSSLCYVVKGEMASHACINEGDLEEYGTEGFKAFISHICSITRVKLAIEDGAIDIDPRLSHIVHRKLKQALKDILWQDRETMINWFDYVPSEISGKIKPLSSVISKDSGNLSSMEKVLEDHSSQSFVTTRFHMRFTNFKDECVYSKLGKEICLVIDIALAKGGPETIVESFYSLMKCHKKAVVKNNENLSLRTKLDWSLHGPFQADRMVKEVAPLYLDGNKRKGLKPHLLPIIGDKCNYKTSKVIDRIENADTK